MLLVRAFVRYKNLCDYLSVKIIHQEHFLIARQFSLWRQKYLIFVFLCTLLAPGSTVFKASFKKFVILEPRLADLQVKTLTVAKFEKQRAKHPTSKLDLRHDPIVNEESRDLQLTRHCNKKMEHQKITAGSMLT